MAAATKTPAYNDNGFASLADWTAATRAEIAEWNAMGLRYDEFVSAWGEDVAKVFDVMFGDVETHLDALENPKRLTGRDSYTGRDLLVDLRHLRMLNQNLIMDEVTDVMVTRVSAPRGKITWGVTVVPGNAEIYAQAIDKIAYKLSVTLNNVKALAALGAKS